MIPLFDSRNEQYRSPFGAQPAGQSVFFRICLPRERHCSGARLCVCFEDCTQKAELPDRNSARVYSMFWAGMEGEQHEWWDCHYTPEEPGLYWYWFELDTAFGRQVLSKQPDGTAVMTQAPKGQRWQLTCYRSGFQTPEWLAGGIFYQIFPDRFARSETVKENIPSDRIQREDWGGQPDWKPDEQGVVRNNDYFGGDLRGIEQRLDRLAELGVTCLYLNPIFEAHSNHRYDTADYTKIDPLLGTEDDFLSLVKTAHQVGIRLILDGVFSHTGADSVYFNSKGRYASEGAAQSPESPYSSWYSFKHWPDQYAAWWGFKTLPEVNELDADFMGFINGAEGVIRKRIQNGISGWRLDVADELPDEFLDVVRRAAKVENKDALVLGEVWEDASHKESYGHTRRYLLGNQLDSVMNYPFRTAVLEFVRNGDGGCFFNRIMTIVENYPPQVICLLMNILGTHDTERMLTVLAGEPANGRGREWQSMQKLTSSERECGLKRMRLATALQYTLPGIPCIYYGDEAGMEGYRDPFNRGCYPWEKEEQDLLHWYHRLGQFRHACPALKKGCFRPLYAGQTAVCYERTDDASKVLCAVNMSDIEVTIPLPEEWQYCTVSMGGGKIQGSELHLPPMDCALASVIHPI